MHIQSQISKSTKREATMSAWEAPPSIVQRMVVGLRANIYCDQRMLWCTFCWLAPSYKVRSRPADRVLDDVREKGCQDQTDEEAKYCDVQLVSTRPEYDGPHKNK